MPLSDKKSNVGLAFYVITSYKSMNPAARTKSMTHCRVPPEPSVSERARNERSLPLHRPMRPSRKRQRPHTTYTSDLSPHCKVENVKLRNPEPAHRNGTYSNHIRLYPQPLNYLLNYVPAVPMNQRLEQDSKTQFKKLHYKTTS
ncbi:hypothetical protein EVAR_98226_1 [Eumeta japonica]|uniref:Uncharacterized protein n=1 Tax=Eumeta variegata TaxID=151549 RepID=A0A4C2A7P4_EUMVA|nr:hypothetical protein EVAR_98226_1 [Eumeta japonica]